MPFNKRNIMADHIAYTDTKAADVEPELDRTFAVVGGDTFAIDRDCSRG
jgi:hypothetical protein